MLPLFLRGSLAVGAVGLTAAMLALPATADAPITVTVNGQTANLTPEPTERAGRVFVPLRGVFEQLGATVVYANGTINATGRGHTVQLKIGSQDAIVDNQPQTVDVAPFIIGASTYVPLRFVSQALGATVNYDGSNNVVAINLRGGDRDNGGGNRDNGGGRPPAEVITPAPGSAGDRGTVSLTALRPDRGSMADSRRPTIGADFVGRADPNTLRITLDNVDVTSGTTRSPHGFTYAPRAPLERGIHHVRVAGTDDAGRAFNRAWDFST